VKKEGNEDREGRQSGGKLRRSYCEQTSNYQDRRLHQGQENGMGGEKSLFPNQDHKQGGGMDKITGGESLNNLRDIKSSSKEGEKRTIAQSRISGINSPDGQYKILKGSK